MITMNEINEHFSDIFECNNTMYVPDKYKNKSSNTPFDEAQFYIQQTKKCIISPDAYSTNV
jgi:hypothetical protein